ncbi:FGGY-family carbohydrate kinase [Haliscomenobacter hydrossis]|uniref:Carbohydrate kinase, FGGY n=1 Tax=Haliscomenobacter hydrossis (strain ATCC 27775 / DSM 1100 / LMG 10767 / O) TaxID=760192 RepID=F4L070_HALH1|nr:FGGY family carbohydrate kinase [Haliscomenobacter hydrossis]AEE52779.1 Carbohydrate kinase, FGGY [Haliscomenobacter hydrossis DSM 1100]
MKTTAFAIFDVGKTNKKLLLFDEEFHPIEAHSQAFPESVDDDGFPCDNLQQLNDWLLGHWDNLRQRSDLLLKGVNFSGYGASFVHLDAQGQTILPLYNYLKPLSPALLNAFYAEIAAQDGQSPEAFAAATCSPSMGMLNSGLQLYWLAKTQPEVFASIKTSLHLPQYLSYLISGEKFSDYTSIGCHTALWDFQTGAYHPWVKRWGLEEKLAPITKDSIATVLDGIMVGVGLHDSSAALLPYLLKEKEPFLLLSTGTWCINLNPFNDAHLSTDALRCDCLAFLTPKGNPVKASRIFFGREHDHQVERIAKHYGVSADFYQKISGGEEVSIQAGFVPAGMQGTGPVPGIQNETWDFSVCPDAISAYHSLMRGLMNLLKQSIQLVDNGVPTLFVDGGFAKNPLFMNMLAADFPAKKIEALEFHQATALGALMHLKNGQAYPQSKPLFT